MSRAITSSILATNLLTLASVAGGQEKVDTAPENDFARGKVVEVVEVLQDPTFTYALYLPSSYTTDEKWPVLYVLDPRGRALTALELFRQAAERNGFIVVSS